MNTLRAYGAPAAGGKFNLVEWLKKPTVLLRLIATVFGLVIWRSVASGCWYRVEDDPPFCVFNRSETTCSATSAIGFFTLATAIALLIIDAQFDKISAVQTRKRIVVLDMAVSGLSALLTSHTASVSSSKYQCFWLFNVNLFDDMQIITTFLIAAVMNCLFDYNFEVIVHKICLYRIQIADRNINVQGGATFFVWRRYYEGSITDFAPPYQTEFTTTNQQNYGYGNQQGKDAAPGVVTDSYQNAPFVAINNMGSPVDMKQFQQGY
uniref:MARVEL domain-containing protein n=1 Tax=Syphacia muris TaxID=451379 RepID=A0A0N5A7K9_9BILA